MAADLEQELSVSLERTSEIVADLQHVLGEYGPGTEAWKALVKELREQEARTAEVGRQLDARSDDRLEKLPGIDRLWATADRIVDTYMSLTSEIGTEVTA